MCVVSCKRDVQQRDRRNETGARGVRQGEQAQHSRSQEAARDEARKARVIDYTSAEYLQQQLDAEEVKRLSMKRGRPKGGGEPEAESKLVSTTMAAKMSYIPAPHEVSLRAVV